MIDLTTGTLTNAIVRDMNPVSTIWNCSCANMAFSGSVYQGHFVPYVFCPGVVSACTGFGSVPEQYRTYYLPNSTR